MNLYITIPKKWNPNNTELINQWFEKIQKHLKTETIKFKDYE